MYKQSDQTLTDLYSLNYDEARGNPLLEKV